MIDICIAAIESPIEKRLGTALVREASRYIGCAETIRVRSQHHIGTRRADFAIWIEAIGSKVVGLVVECDGKKFHNADDDERRDRELWAAKWPTFRFTGSEIAADPAACARDAIDSLVARFNTTNDEPEIATVMDEETFIAWLDSPDGAAVKAGMNAHHPDPPE